VTAAKKKANKKYLWIDFLISQFRRKKVCRFEAKKIKRLAGIIIMREVAIGIKKKVKSIG
jgi:hypothetical protein